MTRFIASIVVITAWLLSFSANAQNICLTNATAREMVVRTLPGETEMSLVMCQILDQEADLASQGYTPNVTIEMHGSIDKRVRMEDREILLHDGTDYVFSGACNRGCNFRGISLVDRESDDIVASTQNYGELRFSFTPTETKPYLLYPSINDCRRNQCTFMVMGFARSK